jgi:ferric iron reductase protein FhuF
LFLNGGKNRIKDVSGINKNYIWPGIDILMTWAVGRMEQYGLNLMECSLVADQKKIFSLDFLLTSCPIFAAG